MGYERISSALSEDPSKALDRREVAAISGHDLGDTCVYLNKLKKTGEADFRYETRVLKLCNGRDRLHDFKLWWKLSGNDWKPIPRFHLYEASLAGEVRRIGSDRPLKPQKSHNGHLYVWLYNGRGGRSSLWVHRAVLLTFVGEGHPGDVVLHRDGNPANNHLTNLMWGTQAENMADKARHGTLIRGESVAVSKLSQVGVLRIRELRSRGMSISALARRYHVSRKAIRDVVNGSTWKHVPEGLKLEA